MNGKVFCCTSCSLAAHPPLSPLEAWKYFRMSEVFQILRTLLPSWGFILNTRAHWRRNHQMPWKPDRQQIPQRPPMTVWQLLHFAPLTENKSCSITRRSNISVKYTWWTVVQSTSTKGSQKLCYTNRTSRTRFSKELVSVTDTIQHVHLNCLYLKIFEIIVYKHPNCKYLCWLGFVCIHTSTS